MRNLLPVIFVFFSFGTIGCGDQAKDHFGRGVELGDMGEHDKAIEAFKEAIRLDPLFPDPLNQLAWIYATCSDADFRNGKQAVVYATKACELSEWTDALIIDTLAAALAEDGDFEKAIEWQEKALLLAPEDQRSACEAQLNLYKAGKPYREE